jgi:hypothetical protein
MLKVTSEPMIQVLERHKHSLHNSHSAARAVVSNPQPSATEHLLFFTLLCVYSRTMSHQAIQVTFR